jgi:predicted nuclease of predicted toxin-antitoxin system
VRFLIDRCAGRRLADWLRQQGHDVLESQQGGADPGDRKLLMWADSEQRVLVTMDKDFGKLIFAAGESHCGVVRLPDVPAEGRIALMEMLLTEHEDDLEAGAVITVKGDRIRISRQAPRHSSE